MTTPTPLPAHLAASFQLPPTTQTGQRNGSVSELKRPLSPRPEDTQAAKRAKTDVKVDNSLSPIGFGCSSSKDEDEDDVKEPPRPAMSPLGFNPPPPPPSSTDVPAVAAETNGESTSASHRHGKKAKKEKKKHKEKHKKKDKKKKKKKDKRGEEKERRREANDPSRSGNVGSTDEGSSSEEDVVDDSAVKATVQGPLKITIPKAKLQSEPGVDPLLLRINKVCFWWLVEFGGCTHHAPFLFFLFPFSFRAYLLCVSGRREEKVTTVRRTLMLGSNSVSSSSSSNGLERRKPPCSCRVSFFILC
jgi:hypothetical protein